MQLSPALISDWLRQAQWVAAEPLDALAALARVHTDSRSVRAGDLFVALRGERFDANDFLADAKKQGAVAAVVQG
ncbi:MAG: UDP-N-acetylmuramoylalanyl-D-glutamyl-2, 6-diaminopimelate--D-alanyl-D-alanine ligase, partial [Rhodoferax sp.]|uniref:Mur ligase domain-containing protein n=1 Tax=Rhodoferax sp. TaxID=50421 RepID=UPI001B42D832